MKSRVIIPLTLFVLFAGLGWFAPVARIVTVANDSDTTYYYSFKLRDTTETLQLSVLSSGRASYVLGFVALLSGVPSDTLRIDSVYTIVGCLNSYSVTYDSLMNWWLPNTALSDSSAWRMIRASGDMDGRVCLSLRDTVGGTRNSGRTIVYSAD